MKVPHRIRITGKISYDVLFTDVVKNDPDCYGYCDPKARQIILKNGRTEKQQASDLLHELIHAIEFESGIPFPHKITYAVESGLMKILTLNKWI